ncbi:MAG: gliding motility lipoprotein GldB [Cytophagales bacterium]|nr:gliding motility lipoprotein GldB [Cytophagales bacterium]MDW8383643.1 gliding motility lipoprotein GldB [Flammeovirgaceae bacterium]
MKKLLLIVLTTMSMFSCSETADEEPIPDVSNVQVEKVSIRRWEKEIFALKTEQEFSSYLEENPLFQRYVRSFTPAETSTLWKVMTQFRSFPQTDTLLADVQQTFSSISDIEKEFEQAFRFLKYYYPEFKQPQIFTIVSGYGALGFGRDIFIAEDMMVISLEYFLGEKKMMYYPPEIPMYILKRYSPQTIVPTTIIMLSAKYNAYDFQDKTLLADMIFYGKSYYFTKKILPYVPDTLILGYTRAELLACRYNVDQIWSHFVEYKGENGYGLFYETQEFIKNKYVGERPKTLEIGDECPGRVGRWLAWEIIKAYMKRNSTMTLPALMEEKNAKYIFEQSKFKPKKPNS